MKIKYKKVLVTLFEIMDYGGIIQHVENLIAGLKEIGVEQVDFVILRWRENSGRLKGYADMVQPGKEGWLPSHTGGIVHQIHGWRDVNFLGYKGKEQMHAWFKFAKQYDLILHEVPCPTLNNSNDGNMDWPSLFGVNRPQIAIVHDGNLEKLYPFFMYVAKFCVGIACVHPAASESCRFIPVRRAIIMSSHAEPPKNNPPWKKRSRMAAAAHIWKRWKRMDDLIRAVPDMPPVKLVVAGDGIERRYMCSKDKCKDDYKNEKGKRIWDIATKRGMKWLGPIDQIAVRQLYQSARVMVDPSWSRKYSELGSHFNRSMWDAVRYGAIPMAHKCHAEYKGVWEYMDSYIPLTTVDAETLRDCDMEERGEHLAQAIMGATSLSDRDAGRIIKSAMSTFHDYAERKAAARMYLKLAEGKKTGVPHPDGELLKCGTYSKEFDAHAYDMFSKFQEKAK